MPAANAQPLTILWICAVVAAGASAAFAFFVLRAAPAKRFLMPLAVLGGLRIFLLGTCVAALTVTAWMLGPDAFALYDENGERQLTFTVRCWTVDIAALGVLCIPVELAYCGLVHMFGSHRLWKHSFKLMGPFAFLVLVIVMDVGMYVPMV